MTDESSDTAILEDQIHNEDNDNDNDDDNDNSGETAVSTLVSSKKRSAPTTTTSSTTTTTTDKSDAKRARALAKGVDYFSSRSPKKASAATAAHSVPSSSAGVNVNERLTDILMQVGINEKNAGQLVKFNAYLKAVNSLKQHPTVIESGAQAQLLDGVGKKIAAKIDEIIATGALRKLEEAKADPKQQALNTLTSVHGVGPVTAKSWFALGIATLDQLRAAVADGSVKLTHEQALGLRYVDAFALKIPRAEMQLHETLVKDAAAAVDPTLNVAIVGSYRRGAAQSGDIDVLVMHDTYGRAEQKAKVDKHTFVKRLVAELERRHYVIDTLNHGVAKFSGVCRLPPSAADADDAGAVRRLDVKIFPRESWAAALLHFTGSGESNRQLRAVALSKRLTLSEFGVQPVGVTGEKGDWLPLDSEQAIYALLGLPYREPHERSL
jgi:DNA polymerase/3'-5' exonuclease PolX